MNIAALLRRKRGMLTTLASYMLCRPLHSETSEIGRVFKLYMPLCRFIKGNCSASNYCLDHQFYADDTQIYHAIEDAKCESDLQQCVNEYSNWNVGKRP